MNTKLKNNAKKCRPTWKWGKDLRNSLGAARETTAPVQLVKMAGDILSGRIEDDGGITEELICNKHLHFELALKLARQWDSRFACDLCNRHDATAEALDEFCVHLDAISAEAFIEHPNIGAGARRKLADLVNPLSVTSMIKLSEIPIAELPSYVNHKNVFVRVAVAESIKDPKCLKTLASDEDLTVREAAVNNPAISVEIAEELALRGDSLTAKVVAAMRTEKPQVLMELAKKLSGTEDAPVAKAIKENKLAPNCETTSAAMVLATLYC